MILQIIIIKLLQIDCEILGLFAHYSGLIQAYWVSVIKPLILVIIVCSLPLCQLKLLVAFLRNIKNGLLNEIRLSSP